MTSATTPETYYDPFDFTIDDDPYPVWKRLRDHSPLYYNEKYDFYALSRFHDVEEALKDWRRETSREMKVPAYVVFTDNTLQAIAEQQPQDERALTAISGIGAKKLEQFGADVLAVVRGEWSSATLDPT